LHGLNARATGKKTGNKTAAAAINNIARKWIYSLLLIKPDIGTQEYHPDELVTTTCFLADNRFASDA